MRSWIPAAVDHDVVLVGHGRCEVELVITLKDDPCPICRMPPHHFPLSGRKLARFRQDILRNAHLAEVVEQAGHAERAHIARTETAELRQRHRQYTHVE